MKIFLPLFSSFERYYLAAITKLMLVLSELVSELVGALSPVNHNVIGDVPICMRSRVKLVSWCFEPSQPQRITSGLNTNFTLYPSHSFHKSWYHKSCFFFLVYLNSMGTQRGNLHPAGWPILFCGPTQELVLATANTGKNQERFWKNAGEWTGRVEISTEEIPCNKLNVYGYILTYSRL